MKKILLFSMLLFVTLCSYCQQYTGDATSIQSSDQAIPGQQCSSTKKLVLGTIKPELMSGTENVYYLKITPSDWFMNQNILMLFFENDFSNTQNVTIECTQDCFYDNGNPTWSKIIGPGERKSLSFRKAYVSTSTTNGPATITNQMSDYKAVEIKITLSDPNASALLHVWYTMECNCTYANPQLLPHPCASNKQNIFVRPANYVIPPYSFYARPGSVTGCNGCNYQLEWTDYIPDETGYEIFSSTDGTNFTLLATKPANSTGGNILYGFIKSSTPRWYKMRATKNGLYSAFTVTRYVP